MEVWTPYQPEHDELEDESYIKPEKGGFGVEHDSSTTSSASHHGLFMEDDILLKRFNDKHNDVVVSKNSKSKKRKDKDSIDRGTCGLFL
jgi:hypothetical protein